MILLIAERKYKTKRNENTNRLCISAKKNEKRSNDNCRWISLNLKLVIDFVWSSISPCRFSVVFRLIRMQKQTELNEINQSNLVDNWQLVDWTICQISVPQTYWAKRNRNNSEHSAYFANYPFVQSTNLVWKEKLDDRVHTLYTHFSVLFRLSLTLNLFKTCEISTRQNQCTACSVLFTFEWKPNKFSCRIIFNWHMQCHAICE